MTILSAIDALGSLDGPVHLAIGVFDGVHRGHEAVLQSACTAAEATGGQPVVATFHPHPAEVLAPDKAPHRLTPLSHQTSLFEKLGISTTLAIPFDLDMASLTAEAFVEKLTTSCRLASIHVGIDWAFGKGRHGNLALLQQLGAAHGFEVHGIAPVLEHDTRISSTTIRQAIGQGDLATTERLLGRPYSLYGEIIHGDHLGRQLGFPTANLDIAAQALPPFGVYIVRLISHENRPGIANLGIRPTVDGKRALRFEVHLLDWDGDLYGQMAEATFLHQLRPERRFDGLPELRDQIGRDLSHAREWLSPQAPAGFAPEKAK